MTALIPAERDQLAALEGVVERGLATFVEVGRALAEIRDARLYRESHATFADYLRERWDMGRSQGYRLIDAAAVVDVVSPNGDTAPPSEAVARELAPLLREDEAKVIKVWRELADEYGDDMPRLPAKVVANAIGRRAKRKRRDRGAAARQEEKRALEPWVTCDGCGVGHPVASAYKDRWRLPGHDRGSHGERYTDTYCYSCYLASGLAAEDARNYADDLDEGRGNCTYGHGWTDGTYEWGGWQCARCFDEDGAS